MSWSSPLLTSLLVALCLGHKKQDLFVRAPDLEQDLVVRAPSLEKHLDARAPGLEKDQVVRAPSLEKVVRAPADSSPSCNTVKWNTCQFPFR